MAGTPDPGQIDTSPSRANLSFGLGIATIAGFILAVVVTDNDGKPEWLWLISPLIGLGALAAGFTAREGGRFPLRAVIGIVIGALAIVNLIAWTIFG